LPDRKVVTRESKLWRADYSEALAATLGEDDDEYTVHCLTPLSRWLLLGLVHFYGQWPSRWVGDWPEGLPDQVYQEAIKGLIDIMACQTDMTRIADATEAMLDRLDSLNDRIGLGPSGQDLNSRLADIETRLGQIITHLPDTPLDPSLIDQIEQILDGVGTILGAATVLA
jgi:hypothetical protein